MTTGAIFFAIIRVPRPAEAMKRHALLPKTFRGQQTHSTSAVGLFGDIVGVMVELIAITFPMDALSEQRVAIRTVHDFMRTNIEMNKGLVQGVTLPAEDEEGYHNNGDGIELFDPMGDITRTFMLSRNGDGRDAELKARTKFKVATPKAIDDNQDVPIWSISVAGSMTIDFSEFIEDKEQPKGTFRVVQKSVVTGKDRERVHRAAAEAHGRKIPRARRENRMDGKCEFYEPC